MKIKISQTLVSQFNRDMNTEQVTTIKLKGICTNFKMFFFLIFFSLLILILAL